MNTAGLRPISFSTPRGPKPVSTITLTLCQNPVTHYRRHRGGEAKKMQTFFSGKNTGREGEPATYDHEESTEPTVLGQTSISSLWDAWDKTLYSAASITLFNEWFLTPKHSWRRGDILPFGLKVVVLDLVVDFGVESSLYNIVHVIIKCDQHYTVCFKMQYPAGMYYLSICINFVVVKNNIPRGKFCKTLRVEIWICWKKRKKSNLQSTRSISLMWGPMEPQRFHILKSRPPSLPSVCCWLPSKKTLGHGQAASELPVLQNVAFTGV